MPHCTHVDSIFELGVKEPGALLKWEYSDSVTGTERNLEAGLGEAVTRASVPPEHCLPLFEPATGTTERDALKIAVFYSDTRYDGF